MVRQLPVTEVKAKLLALITEVEKGEEIEITRHGVTVARLGPARGPHALEGSLAGIARTVDSDDDLFTTGAVWDVE